MTRIVRRETRRRGVFGWLFLIAFWLFNATMAAWLVLGARAVSSKGVGLSGAEAAGHAIGATVGFGLISGIWLIGAVILGLFVLLTRGAKTIVEETVEP